MNLLQRIVAPWSHKYSETRSVTSLLQVGKAQPTPANYEAFARLGYSKNVVCYMAISKIAKAASGIEWCLYKKGKGRKGKKIELTEHPLLTLLERPNPLMGTSTFIENVIAYYVITGNSYIEANMGATGNVPLELWPARPDKMKVVPGKNGYVEKYVFEYNGTRREFPVDPVKLSSKVLQWKSFNPLNDWYGLSPLEAALLSLDQNSEVQKWNLSLLRNSAVPSGVLQMKVSEFNPRGALAADQYTRLKSEMDENFTSSKNAGRPMIIEGGLNWQSISMSPKDMDYLKSKEVSATDVSLALGVPPELMGLGQKTFNNYKEAKGALYTETVLPTLDSFRDNLNPWLTPAFGEGLYLDYDRDDIEALVEQRQAKFTSLGAASFLNENEKRVAAGYEEVPGLDLFKIGQDVMSIADLKAAAEEGSTDPKTSLSGIQITSLLEVISQVATEKIPRETGLQIIMVSFNLTEEQAENILAEVGNGFKPKPEVDPNAKPTSNEPPSKPAQEPTPSQTDDDMGSEEDEDDVTAGKSFKSFNLLNANEKRQSWKRQNQKRKTLQNYFSRDIREDFSELQKALVKAAELTKGSDTKVIEYALVKEVSDWVPNLRKTLKKHTRYALEAFGGAIVADAKAQGIVTMEFKKNLDWDSFVETYVSVHAGEQISSITGSTDKNIKRIIKEWTAQTIRDGDSAKDLAFYLQTEFEELTPASADRIARTEVGAASNNGALEAVKSLQVPGMHKEWVSASDSRVRDGGKDGHGPDHASVSEENGEIPIDDKFKVNPDVLMDGPGDSAGGADQVINCRCVLVFKNKSGGE